MFRTIIISAFILTLLMSGCTGASNTPVSPSMSDGDKAMLDTFIGNDRVLAIVTPGTDMTPNQLRQYFAVNMTKSIVQPMYWCPVYKQFMATFSTLPDATILYWVVYMETQGYDVPNAPPPDAIC